MVKLEGGLDAGFFRFDGSLCAKYEDEFTLFLIPKNELRKTYWGSLLRRIWI